MKKYLSMLLCVMMICFMTSCKSPNVEDETIEDASSMVEEPTKEPEPIEEETEDEEKLSTPVKTEVKNADPNPAEVIEPIEEVIVDEPEPIEEVIVDEPEPIEGVPVTEPEAIEKVPVTEPESIEQVDPWEAVLAAMTIENGKVVSYDSMAFLEIDSHYMDKVAGVYTDGEFYHYFGVDSYYYHESVENPNDTWTKYKGTWQRGGYLDVITVLHEDPKHSFEMTKEETFIIIPGGLIDSSGIIFKRVDY